MENVIQPITEEERARERWIEDNFEDWCCECKHVYRRQDDYDYLYCRLRKRPCPHLAEWDAVWKEMKKNERNRNEDNS